MFKPCELTFGKFSLGTKCITVVLPRGNCKPYQLKFAYIKVILLMDQN